MSKRAPIRRIPHTRQGQGPRPQFSVRLDPETLRRLRALSRRRSQSMASLVIPVIEAFARQEIERAERAGKEGAAVP